MKAYYYLDVALICLCIALAMSYAYVAVVTLKKRKKILQVVQKTNIAVEEHLEMHQKNLKQALANLPDEGIAHCINDIHLIEKESLNKLINLIIENQAAAIEMTPLLINQMINKYIHCTKQVALAGHLASGTTEPEEDMDTLQYEALIEQLRAEKHDYADKFKATHDLLSTVYRNYKDTLQLNNDRPLEKLSLEEIATVFGLEWTSPKTEYTPDPSKC